MTQPEKSSTPATSSGSATPDRLQTDEGKISVDLAVRLLNCQPVPRWVVSNQALITPENVSQFPNPPAYQP